MNIFREHFQEYRKLNKSIVKTVNDITNHNSYKCLDMESVAVKFFEYLKLNHEAIATNDNYLIYHLYFLAHVGKVDSKYNWEEWREVDYGDRSFNALMYRFAELMIKHEEFVVKNLVKEV